ncbi:hypothetical protein K7432_011667 [Basidiobolus ranarum]|uniref:Transmembrane protein n=1 Tax=Basidiobolus ranarum TaxID=34480 RepID=A0ABR2VU90_9FUNG
MGTSKPRSLYVGLLLVFTGFNLYLFSPYLQGDCTSECESCYRSKASAVYSTSYVLGIQDNLCGPDFLTKCEASCKLTLIVLLKFLSILVILSGIATSLKEQFKNCWDNPAWDAPIHIELGESKYSGNSLHNSTSLISSQNISYSQLSQSEEY